MAAVAVAAPAASVDVAPEAVRLKRAWNVLGPLFEEWQASGRPTRHEREKGKAKR